jgi:DNA-binding transcriptional LysR family regulator
MPSSSQEPCTDLSLTAKGDSYQLMPRSVLGMLWLQTHFETSTWDLICSGAVRLKVQSCDRLCRDAVDAGLGVARIPAVHLAAS